MYRVKTNKHGGMILDKDIATFEQAKRIALECAEISVMVDGGPMILSFDNETNSVDAGWGEYISVEKY